MGKATRRTGEEDERAALMEALAATRAALNAARSSFEQVCEPELVEACVYEMGSLEARYDYLLRRLRELGAAAPLRFRPAR